jgi:hypothetical protein
MKKPTIAAIIKDAERSIKHVNELFADTAHWNRLHPDEQIAPDPDGQMAKLKEYAEALIRECRRPRALNEPIIVKDVPLPECVKERMVEEYGPQN